MFWNLYIDDVTLLEVVESLEVDKNGKVVKSGWQEIMERTYSSLGVPFSQEKASSRELICEKLGALLDGKNGRLGVTTKRSLDFISLGLFLLSVDKVPTKWVQILLGKYVHVLQFRRPLFSQVNWLWKRIGAFNRGNAFSAEEVEVGRCSYFLCATLTSEQRLVRRSAAQMLRKLVEAFVLSHAPLHWEKGG